MSQAAILVLLVMIIAPTFASLPVTKMLRDDPNQDIFNALDADLLDEWSHNYDLTLTERALQLLTPIEEVVQIQVVLVGFDDIEISPATFSSYLDRLPHKIPVHVVKGQKLTSKQRDDEFDSSTDFNSTKIVDKIMEEEEATKGKTGNLLVNRVAHYKVVKGSSSLEDEFYKTIKQYSKTGAYSEPQITIPFSAIDDIVETDFQQGVKRFGPSVISIYVFNSVPSKRPYYYTDDGLSGNPPSSTQTGSSRWMWLDLAAGPISRGPKFAGEGLVTSTVIPFIQNYYFNKEFTGGIQLQTDLAAWVRRTTELLLCPAVDHLPYLLSPSRSPERTVIQLVMFHDHPVGEEEKYGMFKANVLSRIINELPSLPEQTIMFSSNDVSIHEDINAATVFANSLRDYVYPEVEDDEQVLYHIHQYLDSNALHYWLSKFERTFYPNARGVHYIPIFVFDFSHTDMMLIDRKHQVVSFPDMVIGIQTEDSQLRVPFKAGQRALYVNGRDVTRQLLGAVIQSAWGVLPTDLFWSHSHQRLENDYMWSTGRTPFGVFSESTELSFVQTDGIYKPQLYQLINQTLSHVIEPLLSVRSYGFELYHLLDDSDYAEFVVRWNLYRYKLKECGEDMSLHEWTDAYHFVRSAYKDSEVLLKLLLKAQDSISSILQCGHKPPTKSWWNTAIVGGSIVVAIVLFVYLFSSKRSKLRKPNAKKYD